MRRAAKIVFREYGLTVGLAIGFALGVRIYLIEAYRIPGPSMHPTLEAGDTIFVTKWGFKEGANLAPTGSQGRIRHGDVIVFSSTQPTPGEYIRRVVGLPGDVIEIKKGLLHLNGKAMTAEPKQNPPCTSEVTPDQRSYTVCLEAPLLEDLPPLKVPPGSVYVLSDLRSAPADFKRTRTPTLVPVGTVKGKARWIWLSVDPDSNVAGIFPRIRFERMFRGI